ncbi:MAG TPA: N-acetyltransferase [Sedimenticola sp.]|nr:N-acetyltransferase [Sedimenticola sp.]
MTECELEFTIRTDPDETLGQYVLLFEGKAITWNDEASEEQPVATIQGHRIDLAAALHDGLTPAEILHSLTPEIDEFAETVLKDGKCLLPPDAEHPAGSECECLVYISTLNVEPGFRGQGLGTRLLRRLGSTIDMEHCLIALKALPIREDPAHTASEAQIARVKRFYERNGFEHAGKDYMVKDARRCEAIKKRLAMRARAR